MAVLEGDEEVEKSRKNTSRENRKPRTKLIRQQSAWRTNQKMVAGDLIAPSTVASEALRKLLLRRVCCCNAVSCFILPLSLSGFLLFLFLFLLLLLPIIYKPKQNRREVASKKWGWVRNLIDEISSKSRFNC